MLRRRAFLGSLTAALASPRLARAQSSERSYRLCWLSTAALRNEAYNVAFVQRLAELGFVEGRNLVIDLRTAEGRVERFPAVVAELVRQPCALLFAPGGEPSVRAAVQGSRDVPIVIMANDYDPVATGHVTSLSRPGGRITGIAQLQSELPAKRLELLKQLLPKARRIAVFTDSNTTGQLKIAQSAARSLGLTLHVIEFTQAPYDYDRAFADAVRGKADAVFPLASAFFVPGRHRIPELALRHRLPSIFANYLWTEAGGLLSYGPSFPDIYRRAAELVAMILRGTKPADIPVEESAHVELVINLKTAKALGIAFPEPLRLRASRVID